MHAILKMGMEYIERCIRQEKERLHLLNNEIEHLEKLKETRAQCAAIIAEYEALLGHYDKEQTNATE